MSSTMPLSNYGVSYFKKNYGISWVINQFKFDGCESAFLFSKNSSKNCEV